MRKTFRIDFQLFVNGNANHKQLHICLNNCLKTFKFRKIISGFVDFAIKFMNNLCKRSESNFLLTFLPCFVHFYGK